MSKSLSVRGDTVLSTSAESWDLWCMPASWEFFNWGWFEKAAVEQKTKWNFSICQLLSVRIQRWIVRYYLEHREFLLTINIVLCWLYSCYYLFPAFVGIFLQGSVWPKIGSFSSAICKLMKQSKKIQSNHFCRKHWRKITFSVSRDKYASIFCFALKDITRW